MNFPLRNIIILVLVALTGLFVWQLYWLYGLYESERATLEKTITDAMIYSDFGEMEVRFKKQKANGMIKGSLSINTYSEEDHIKNKHVIKSRSVKEYGEQKGSKPDTTITKETEDNDSTFTMLVNLVEIARSAIHRQMDEIIKADIQVYDSLLTAKLDQAGIKTNHLSSLCRNGKIIAKAGTKGYQPDNDAETFTIDLYSGEDNSVMQYKLQTEPLTRTLLMQMVGILTASALIIIILAFVFWYLVHTLVRIKNLDEMKTDFSNNITHELKTPIAVALAANDALLNYGMDADVSKRKEYLGVCREQLNRLSGMVEQILSMSMERRKNMALNITDVELKATIDGLTHEHKLKADKQITFSVSVTPENATVKADPMHIRNILSNLIDNAVKYSNDSVNITINVQKTNNGVDIEVSDNGIGIAKEKLKYVFDRFYRVADGNRYTVKGYGLGLYYVKTMTEKLGGTVAVESHLGMGTTFKMHFNE